MDIFHNFLYIPFFNLLMFLYNIFGQNLGAAIIAIGLITKLIMIPLSRSQKMSAEKSKQYQEQLNIVKKKYAKNKEKYDQEMMKLNSQFLPAQLGGCLNLIITLVFLIQTRNVIFNLVHQGVHAYNQVAYSEQLKLPESTVSFKLPSEISYGVYDIEYKLESTKGDKIDKTFRIGIAENDEQKNKFTDLINKINERLSQEEKDRLVALEDKNRQSGLSVFISEFENVKAIVGRDREIKAFLRPPSNQLINFDTAQVSLRYLEFNDQNALTNPSGENVSFSFESKDIALSDIKTQTGVKFNMDFLGLDLSKVGIDIDGTNVAQLLPYIILALFVGGTQYLSTKLQTAMMPTAPTKPVTKKGKGKEEEPSFAEAMAQSTKTTMVVFPVFTALMSLGYLGGASFFPSGVSLFWTVQNSFAIIQGLGSDFFKNNILNKVNNLLNRQNGDNRSSDTKTSRDS